MQHPITPPGFTNARKSRISRREALRRIGGGVAAVWLASVGLAMGVRPAHAATDTAWVARHGLTAADYQTQFTSLVNQGYRLLDVSGYEVGGQARYAAIWDKSGGPAWTARHGLTADQYQSEFNSLVGQGYRPIRVCGYVVGGQDYYAAIFEKSGGVVWEAHHRLTAAQYQTTFNTLTSQGYRPLCVSGYNLGGQDTYAAIFVKSSGPAWEAHHGLTADQYQSLFNSLGGQGYHVVDLSAFASGGQIHYAAIWEKSPATWQGRHGLTGAQYQIAFDNLRGQGYRPVCVSGCGISGQDYYAAIFENNNYQASELGAIQNDITQFMQKYSVPGASIAISKDGRLVYASGFGFADKEHGVAVDPGNLFRIASVTKPITSTTIFTLIEQGKLKPSDRVFGQGGVLGTTYGHTPYGTNIEKITIQNLLEHTAGGWTNDNQDPMFSHPEMNQSQLISWVLDNRPLDNVPGTHYAYSNFGYCLLGRVIEKVTGQTYANYVQNAVLGPCGISDMAIAGNTLADRRPNEVIYYGQNGEDPYGMQVTRMDSHGGWLATATDLLRFAVRVDGFATRPDILNSASIATMTTGSTANSGYAKGWAVNQYNNWWHTGSLPGTGTILVRTSGGFCWAALLNTRSTSDAFFGDLDNLMWKVNGEVKNWPGYDLF